MTDHQLALSGFEVLDVIVGICIWVNVLSSWTNFQGICTSLVEDQPRAVLWSYVGGFVASLGLLAILVTYLLGNAR